LTAVFLGVVFFPSFAAERSTVPMEVEGGVIFVSGQIDGSGPLRFVFDPGAEDLITTDGRSHLSSAQLTKLRLGSATFPVRFADFPGNSTDLVPNHTPARGTVAGSIGPALLKRYAVEVDYAAATMRLTPLKAFTPPPNAARLPFTLDAYDLPVVDVDIDGAPARVELDLRAPTSMLFPAFLERSGVGAQYANAAVVKRSSRGVAHDLHTVSIAGIRVSGVTTWFSQAKSGKFASSSAAGLFGNNVWSRFVVTLDYRRRAAYVVPAKRAEIR
jgi:hypothetical protein